MSTIEAPERQARRHWWQRGKGSLTALMALEDQLIADHTFEDLGALPPTGPASGRARRPVAFRRAS